MHIFKNTKFNFLRWRWEAIALSWALIIAGAVMFWRVGIPLGIEFAGGTEVIEQFDQPPIQARSDDPRAVSAV
jgi:preprotein translocase subunit SecF